LDSAKINPPTLHRLLGGIVDQREQLHGNRLQFASLPQGKESELQD
jgi:hypothetical protein